MASGRSASPRTHVNISAAARSVVENLEQRRLFATAPTQIGINFGPYGSEANNGYFTDSGEQFGTQQFGYDYGWQTAVPATSFYERSASKSQKLETGVNTTTGNKWEIAVPNGTYRVRVVAGDANVTSGTYKYNVESTLNFVNGAAASGDARWITASGDVTVTDGRLTLQDNGGTQHALAYVDVVLLSDKNASVVGKPTGLTATARLSTQVDLRWVDNANNEDFDGGYIIERRTGSSGTWGVISTTDGGVRQYQVDYQNVLPGTRYEYRVKARRTNTSGQVAESSYSDIVGVTTPANDTQAAYGGTNWAVPGLVQAEDYDKGAPGDAFNDVTSANAGGFYRAGSLDVGWLGTENIYFVGWVKANEWQEYTTSVDASQAGTYYVEARVSSAGAGGTWKIAVDGLDASTDNQVADTGGFHNYAIQRSGQFQLAASTKRVLRFQATSEDPTGKFVGNFDSFRVVRFDSPVNPIATAASSSQVNLSWTGRATNASKYLIERKVGSTGEWAEIGSVAGNVTSFVDTRNVSGNTTYSYRVRASRVDATSVAPADYTAYSPEVSVTTPNAGEPPAAPTNLNATLAGSAVALSWSDNANNETAHRIERRIGGTTPGAWATIGTALADATGYSDRAVAPNTSYDYRVRAVNLVGDSPASNVASIRTGATAESDASEDTYARSGSAYANVPNGGADSLEVKGGTSVGFERQAFFKFALPTGLGTGTDITNVTLRVYGRRNTTDDGSAGITMQLRAVPDASWSESTLTFNNKPAMASSVIGSFAVTSTTGAWHEIDLTSHVREQLAAGKSIISLGLTGAASTTAFFSFEAKEHDSANHTRLQITTAPVVEPPPAVAPTAPSNLIRVVPPENSVTVSWTDNSNNESGFEVERKTGVAGLWSRLGTTSANVKTLPDDSYVATLDQLYRVRALGGTGTPNSGYSNELAIPAQTAAPTVDVAAGAVTLAWSDSSALETAYRVERRVSNTAGWSTIASLGANTTTHVDDTVVEGQRYDYRVRAVSSSSDGIASASSSAAISLKPPSDAAVTSVRATSANAASVALTWADKSEHEAGFEVQRRVSGTNAWTSLNAVNPVTANAFVDQTALADLLYDYQVRAVAASAEASLASAFSGVISGVATPPAAASGLKLDAATDSSVTLSWMDNAKTEIAYRIERRVNGAADFDALPGTLAANAGAHLDLALAEATRYEYRVRPVSEAGEGWASNTLPVVTRLRAPSGLSAAAAGSDAVNVTWVDHSNAETGFEIQYSTDAGFDAAATTTVLVPQGNGASHVFGGLTAGVEHHVRVRAVNDDVHATSAYTSSASVMLPAGPIVVAPPTDVTAALATIDSALIDWTASAQPGVAEYSVYVSTDGGNTYVEAARVPASETAYIYYTSTAGSFRFQVSGWKGETESVRVDAVPVQAGGTGSDIDIDATVAPAAPTSLGVSGDAYTDSVPLSWQPSPGATGYVIEWSSDGSGWFAIAEVSGTSYTDEDPTLGGQHYRIVPMRGATEPVFGTPSDGLPVHPIAPPVAWYDDNAGANVRGTLSPFNTKHDVPLTFSVIPNDVDYDSSTIRIPSDGFTQPENGHVTLNNETGAFTYKPKAGFVGTDTFTYWVTDGFAESKPAKVAIDVTNAVPVADIKVVDHGDAARSVQWDSATNSMVEFNTSLSVTLPGSDGDDDPLVFAIAEGPKNGSVKLDPKTGIATYISDGTEVGRDRFTYTVSDGFSEPVYGAVLVHRHRASVERSSARVAYKDTVVDLNRVGPGKPLLVPPGGSPQHGTLWVLRQSPSGAWLAREKVVEGQVYHAGQSRWEYEPEPGYEGADSYLNSYYSLAKPAVVGISVTPTPPYPYTGYTGSSWSKLYHPVSAFEPTTLTATQAGFSSQTHQGDPATLSISEQPKHGTIALAAGGGWTYTPNNDAEEPFDGWDFFQMKVVGTFVTGVPYELRQWIQLDVHTDTLPSAAPPPPTEPEEEDQWQPGPYDGSLKQLWQKYIDAKDQSKKVLEALVPVGAAIKAVENASDDDAYYLAIDVAATALDKARPLFDGYVQKYTDLNNAAAMFARDTVFVTPAKTAVHAAIASLPIDFAGLRATKDHFQQIKGALDDFGDAAAVQIDTAAMVVTVAETTHNVAEVASMAGGGGLLLKGGAKLAIAGVNIARKEGVVALARASLPVAAKVGTAAAVGYATSSAESRARALGMSEEQIGLIKIAAQATQLIPGLQAVKMKAMASTSRPFKAPLSYVAGKMLKFPGIKTQSKVFTTRTSSDNDRMRREFEASSGPKQQFLEGLAEDPNMRKIFSPAVIADLRNGIVPKNFDVHHKTPLKLGGTNDLDNLILMQKGTEGGPVINYYSALTNYQKSLTDFYNKDAVVTFETQWPVFPGKIYPPGGVK